MTSSWDSLATPQHENEYPNEQGKSFEIPGNPEKNEQESKTSDTNGIVDSSKEMTNLKSEPSESVAENDVSESLLPQPRETRPMLFGRRKRRNMPSAFSSSCEETTSKRVKLVLSPRKFHPGTKTNINEPVTELIESNGEKLEENFEENSRNKEHDEKEEPKIRRKKRTAAPQESVAPIPITSDDFNSSYVDNNSSEFPDFDDNDDGFTTIKDLAARGIAKLEPLDDQDFNFDDYEMDGNDFNNEEGLEEEEEEEEAIKTEPDVVEKKEVVAKKEPTMNSELTGGDFVSDEDNPNNDDEAREDRMRNAKTLDDYVILDSQRKYRKWISKKERSLLRRKRSRKKRLKKSESEENHSEEEGGEKSEEEIKAGEEDEDKPLAAKMKSRQQKPLSSGQRPCPDRKIYGCLFCKYCGRKADWLKHLYTKHQDKGLVYCEHRLCKMPFDGQEKLEAHSEVHKIRHICNYEGCGKEFKFASVLREHRKAHYPQQEVPFDGDCSVDKLFICTFCGKKFKTRSGWKSHEAVAHTKQLDHKCPVEGCNKAFYKPDVLAKHVRRHTGDLPFTCSYCGNRFISQATLVQHEKATHLETEDTECEICHKRLRKRNLPAHVKIHQGFVGLPCRVCGKEFPTTPARTRHEKIHYEQKEHSCRYCGKAFVQKSNMKAHERIHTGEKPFKCQFCGEGFVQQTRRNQHQSGCKQR